MKFQSLATASTRSSHQARRSCYLWLNPIKRTSSRR